jgi:antitoxin VapB
MRRLKRARKGSTLYIKNPIAHRLAEQISKRDGVTLSDAVIAALEDKVRQTPQPFDRTKVEAVLKKFDSLPILDTRSEDEILGYDEFGIPR